jgi:hypothetical protein
VGAGNGESEIPLLLTLFYLFRESEAGHCPSFWTQGSLCGPIRAEDIVRWGVWLGRHIC